MEYSWNHATMALKDDDRRAERNAIVKIDDVLIEQANAAARDRTANGRRFVGAVYSKITVAVADIKIERPRAERVLKTAGHASRISSITRDSS